MNPNSQHQLWSKWTYRVRPDPRHHPTMADVQLNCARFGKKAFGEAAQMRIRFQQIAIGVGMRLHDVWEISVLAEGLPAHEAPFAEWMHAKWLRFFRNGFGVGCRVTSEAHVMAGDVQDGRPPDQMLIVPTISSLS